MSESKTPRTDATWLVEWEQHRRDPRASPAHGMLDLCQELERDLAAARAEVERLRKDAARLDYLQNLTDENGECWMQHVRTHDGFTVYQICTSYDEIEPDKYVDIRVAIDALAAKDPT